MNLLKSAIRAGVLLICMCDLALAAEASAADADRDTTADVAVEMRTRAVVREYFDALSRKNGWEQAFADKMTFTSFTSPVKQVNGKAAYLEATQRFYESIRSVTMRELLIEGDRACALTRYELQPPNGSAFTSDVAEVFTVRDGRIQALAIYFDTAPFPK
jgi:ketosteroid isomerase-like protein